MHQVKKVGYSEDDANALLERAFGWRTQTFWRGLKKEEVPNAGSVAATLNFLRELGEPSCSPFGFGNHRWLKGSGPQGPRGGGSQLPAGARHDRVLSHTHMASSSMATVHVCCRQLPAVNNAK